MATNGQSKIVGGGAEGSFELPGPEGPCVMRQVWRDLLFLHWEVPAEVVQATLPRGLRVDTFGGKAYVGIVPFQMEKVRPRFCPPMPGISWFGELNLRTYVVGPGGAAAGDSGRFARENSGGGGLPGVWFYSLDAHQRLAVWLARTFFSLPYHYAKIQQRDWPDPGRGRKLDYFWERGQHRGRRRKGAIKGTRGRRRFERSESASAEPAFVYRTPPTHAAKAAPAGTLEHWLVERYLLFSRRPLFVPGPGKTTPDDGGGLYVGRVEHEPYRVAPVEVEHAEASLFGLNGFDLPSGPPVSALWSPGVDVRIYPLRSV